TVYRGPPSAAPFPSPPARAGWESAIPSTRPPTRAASRASPMLTFTCRDMRTSVAGRVSPLPLRDRCRPRAGSPQSCPRTPLPCRRRRDGVPGQHDRDVVLAASLQRLLDQGAAGLLRPHDAAQDLRDAGV